MSKKIDEMSPEEYEEAAWSEEDEWSEAQEKLWQEAQEYLRIEQQLNEEWAEQHEREESIRLNVEQDEYLLDQVASDFEKDPNLYLRFDY